MQRGERISEHENFTAEAQRRGDAGPKEGILNQGSTESRPTIFIAALCRGAATLLFGLSDAVFFVFQLGLEFAFIVGELAAEFLKGFFVAGGGGLVDFRFQRDFALGDFGGVFGVELRQFFFLGGGEFDGGRGFVESLHREFVGAFHNLPRL